MSPAYREPPQRKGENEADRSVWTTTGIYIALIVLTILMALGFNSISDKSAVDPQGVRASRGP